MDYVIRRLYPRELTRALRLAQRTYLAFEAPEYGPEGVETFRRDILENAAFHAACRSGENRMWGAFDGRKLVGMMVMRGAGHITLAFVDGDFHRRGIGTALFRALLREVRRENPEVEAITLNSSPFGEPFYHKLGFVDTGPRRIQGGIVHTPMEYRIQRIEKEEFSCSLLQKPSC